VTLATTSSTAIIYTAITFTAVVALSVFFGMRLARRLFHIEKPSPERAKSARKVMLLMWGYLALLLVLGLVIWLATGYALAGVFTPVALMFVASFIFQFLRPRMERRLAARKARGLSSDPQ
jgi:predicted PurR-regulated permease PerM